MNFPTVLIIAKKNVKRLLALKVLIKSPVSGNC